MVKSFGWWDIILKEGSNLNPPNTLPPESHHILKQGNGFNFRAAFVLPYLCQGRPGQSAR